MGLETDCEKGIVFCDDKGRLSLTAVAASPIGKELAELVEEGIEREVLSWRMDVEEPKAASVISQVMSTGQEMALRTTELTAVAVLRGETIVQRGKNLIQQVVIQSVRERVRHELGNAADDPDLPEVFDYLISQGVGKKKLLRRRPRGIRYLFRRLQATAIAFHHGWHNNQSRGSLDPRICGGEKQQKTQGDRGRQA